MTPSPSAVLFDLDGTLLDTANDLAGCLNLLLSEEQRPALPLSAIRLHVSNGANAMLDFGFGLIEVHEKQRLRIRLLELYEANIALHTCWFEGLEDLTKNLKQAGIPWGIVTNKPRLYTDLLLDAMKITQQVDVVVCPDDLGIAKPDPRPLLHACNSVNASPDQAIYIGDHIRDIQAGKAAGMRTIAAAYGYIDPSEKILEWGADQIAFSGIELARMLQP